MRTTRLSLAGLTLACAISGLSAFAADLDPRLRQDEEKRIAAVKKVQPAVVAIFAAGGQGGGSGVLISDDGYALTNFHVVEGSGPVMQCGLADGNYYDAVLVGTDKVGDVSLVKLLPKKEGQKFPFAALGDSDKLKAGDWSLAMGNPFLLATDFVPTVTYGMISGVHRYQYPAGVLLEYTDCIQVDTSINPGNSGGPLFNMDGELVGINGRGSFEKRGRVNSGVGYAISINQIKNFMGHLRAGLDVDHATPGFRAVTKADQDGDAQIIVGSILEDCDAHRRGIDPDDELVSFVGRPVTSVNQFKNVLGLFPKGWRVPIVYRRDNSKREVLIRLMGVQQRELVEPMNPNQPKPPENPARPKKPIPNSPATKLYVAKDGFANFYFNKQERDRLLAAFRTHGDFAKLAGAWKMEADGTIKAKKITAAFTVAEEKDGNNAKPVVHAVVDNVKFDLEPLKKQDIRELKEPKGSGGLLLALYQYWLLQTVGEKAFEGDFSHGGNEPFYLPSDDPKPDYLKQRVDTEVLRTEHAGIAGKWYFSQKDHLLLGFEIKVEEDGDPCEVYLSDYRSVDGKMLPHKMEVRFGNDRYGAFTINRYQLAAK
jgi:serine protease Do